MPRISNEELILRVRQSSEEEALEREARDAEYHQQLRSEQKAQERADRKHRAYQVATLVIALLTLIATIVFGLLGLR